MMSDTIKLEREDPIIHIKAYGGVQIQGIEQLEVQCETRSPQLATLVEEDNHVYITANAACQLKVPQKASIKIEKAMGSVKISGIMNDIKIEKVLGNLVLNDIGSAHIEKIGGNFSVRFTTGKVLVEKVAGKLTVEKVPVLYCQKVGGSCIVKDVSDEFDLEKAGGSFSGQTLRGNISVENIGGSFIAKGIDLTSDLKVGGGIKLDNFTFTDGVAIKAGGDIDIGLGEFEKDLTINIDSGTGHIRVRTQQVETKVDKYQYQLALGEGGKHLHLAAGGSVLVTDQAVTGDEIVGDLSEDFKFEESALSKIIQERVDAATKLADAKIRAAQIRLERLQEDLERKRGINIDPEQEEVFTEVPAVPSIVTPPPVSRPAGMKSATSEERLMILKMLQDKKITVDEAELLFKTLKD